MYVSQPGSIHDKGQSTEHALVMGKCGHSFHMVGTKEEIGLFTQMLIAAALSPSVDPARFLERLMSNVSSKYGILELGGGFS